MTDTNRERPSVPCIRVLKSHGYPNKYLGEDKERNILFLLQNYVGIYRQDKTIFNGTSIYFGAFSLNLLYLMAFRIKKIISINCQTRNIRNFGIVTHGLLCLISKFSSVLSPMISLIVIA